MANPLEIDTRQSRFGWRLNSDVHGSRQSAYQVIVAGSTESLARNEGDRWDSGRAASSQSTHIPYHGKPLRSGDRCFWKVRAWDADGVVSAFSPVASFEMGLLERDDWSND